MHSQLRLTALKKLKMFFFFFTSIATYSQLTKNCFDTNEDIKQTVFFSISQNILIKHMHSY